MQYQILSVAICLFLTFAEVMSDNPDCPEKYQRFSTSHTYCLPKNQSCDILRSRLSQQEIDQVVNLHNQYRNVIATRQKGSKGLPTAADMLYMEWDSELAKIAQRLADQCVFAHDRGEQRRVQNFGVGQNIAQMSISGSNVQRPKPDWPGAIAMWYNEIENFTSHDMICGSRDQAPGEIGHFTQVVWSKSFRIGCGYTMYKDGNTYIRLYVCNYGPGGNSPSCVYKQGAACSKCPSNTQCSAGSQYPGLCKRINDEAPYQLVREAHIFNCNFMNYSSADCKLSVVGDSNSWHYISTLSGTYLEAVLQPGQNETVVFSKRIISSLGAKSMCVQVRYRKGPTLAKNPQNNVGKVQFFVPAYNNWIADYDLHNFDGGYRHQFTTYPMKMGWKESSEMKISFAVPTGATPQFLNIASIVGFDNKCVNVE